MKIIDCIQGSDEWLLARLGKVTGSKFAEATSDGRGSNPSETRKKYMEKRIAERMHKKPIASYSNENMDRGSELESLARERYEEINGLEVQQVGFVEYNEDIGCSPDGLIGDDGMLEIKCPLPHTHIRYLRENRLPTTYVKQVQGGLWVCEREWCDFFSFDPDNMMRPFFCKRVYRDEKIIKELHIKLIMFVTEMKETMDKLTANPF